MHVSAVPQVARPVTCCGWRSSSPSRAHRHLRIFLPACGQLAVEELNRVPTASRTSGRAGGRRRRRDPEAVADELGELVDPAGRQPPAEHLRVRVAVTRRLGGRVVYAYAAMHEGRDDTPGVFMLGERPINQLLPAARMREQLGVGRWAVGTTTCSRA